MSKIIDFYSGKSVKPYSYNDVCNFTEHDWENKHDFIQIVFPNRIPSKYNPDAPILTDYDLVYLQKHYSDNVEDMISRFMCFLGYCGNIIGGTSTVWWYPCNHESVKNRVSTPNHNSLRITRMLKFLYEFDKNLCIVLFHTLIQANRDFITQENWVKAVEGK